MLADALCLVQRMHHTCAGLLAKNSHQTDHLPRLTGHASRLLSALMQHAHNCMICYPNCCVAYMEQAAVICSTLNHVNKLRNFAKPNRCDMRWQCHTQCAHPGLRKKGLASLSSGLSICAIASAGMVQLFACVLLFCRLTIASFALSLTGAVHKSLPLASWLLEVLNRRMSSQLSGFLQPVHCRFSAAVHCTSWYPLCSSVACIASCLAMCHLLNCHQAAG